ncbi:SCO0930 family lipoprotein [Wenjunlia tyrosinilytica]|uniref:Lipoprotein n=1 Tax=Wenjunlia tyrosinilytica TaxID=1544741 RepID=A0A917ZJB1_9ACTN|nr:SCO0930 family lipoprotein [Wenjunlia tyrosinilytica]GGO84087.1 lipoprotein [Wenjunlia tyrosinilytica]
MRKWQSASLAGTAAVLMLTAACGTEKPNNNSAPAGAVQPAAGSDSQAGGGYDYGTGSGNDSQSTGKARSAGELAVWESKKLGPVVTDSAGFTLYRFDKDTANPPKSNCSGACAKTWPAVPAGDASASAAIDSSLLGTVKRADGTEQLTLAGWPLYRYAKDTAPKQANGQGVGGVWFAAAPNGKKASVQTGGGDQAGNDTADLPALSTRQDDQLGEILQDGKGRTLYRFAKDVAWPMKIACVGDCLTTWKPAKPIDKADIKGINPKLISTITRPDGLKQLAIDCWPVYWFTGDKKPGDTNGQGVKNLWFTVTKEGKKVLTKKADSSDSGSSSSGGGYSSTGGSSSSSGGYSY